MRVLGDKIIEYFSLTNIGGVGCLIGEWDNTEVNIFIIKEPNYNMIMMLKDSSLTVQGGQNEGTRIVHGDEIKLKYPAIFLIIIYTGGQWKITMDWGVILIQSLNLNCIFHR